MRRVTRVMGMDMISYKKARNLIPVFSEDEPGDFFLGFEGDVMGESNVVPPGKALSISLALGTEKDYEKVKEKC